MALTVLAAATADGTGSTFERNDYSSAGRYGVHVVSAIFKYKKTNTGTCTLQLKDGLTDAVITTLTVGAGNPAAAAVEVAVPETFYAEISNDSGTFALDAYLDGL